jgi:phytanoyl-CoA hydroxylase
MKTFMEKQIKDHGIDPVVFNAEPGDVLIWHANLVHGGSPHLNKEKTRRSMVMHYFGKDVVCYHELTQRPAIIK